MSLANPLKQKAWRHDRKIGQTMQRYDYSFKKQTKSKTTESKKINKKTLLARPKKP